LQERLGVHPIIARHGVALFDTAIAQGTVAFEVLDIGIR
jgi:hypothetical protein